MERSDSPASSPDPRPDEDNPPRSPRPVQVKQEPGDDIKDYAETTMNELLGWYGYDKVDSSDTQALNLDRYQQQQQQRHPRDDNSDSQTPPLDGSDDESRDNDSSRQRSGSPSSSSPILCAWCQKRGLKLFTLRSSTGLKTFCSEICFTQCRRASFKKNKVCDWCKHVRHTVNYVDFQDGEQQLQFCSEKCLNQYKMNIFCKETQEHLHHIRQARSGADSSEASNDSSEPKILITPELWMAGGGGHSSFKEHGEGPDSEHGGEPGERGRPRSRSDRDRDRDVDRDRGRERGDSEREADVDELSDSRSRSPSRLTPRPLHLVGGGSGSTSASGSATSAKARAALARSPTAQSSAATVTSSSGHHRWSVERGERGSSDRSGGLHLGRDGGSSRRERRHFSGEGRGGGERGEKERGGRGAFSRESRDSVSGASPAASTSPFSPPHHAAHAHAHALPPNPAAGGGVGGLGGVPPWLPHPLLLGGAAGMLNPLMYAGLLGHHGGQQQQQQVTPGVGPGTGEAGSTPRPPSDRLASPHGTATSGVSPPTTAHPRPPPVTGSAPPPPGAPPPPHPGLPRGGFGLPPGASSLFPMGMPPMPVPPYYLGDPALASAAAAAAAAAAGVFPSPFGPPPPPPAAGGALPPGGMAPGHGGLPPVTVMVPFPVMVPVPVPIPIPLPIGKERLAQYFKEKAGGQAATATVTSQQPKREPGTFMTSPTPPAVSNGVVMPGVTSHRASASSLSTSSSASSGGCSGVGPSSRRQQQQQQAADSSRAPLLSRASLDSMATASTASAAVNGFALAPSSSHSSSSSSSRHPLCSSSSSPSPSSNTAATTTACFQCASCQKPPGSGRGSVDTLLSRDSSGALLLNYRPHKRSLTPNFASVTLDLSKRLKVEARGDSDEAMDLSSKDGAGGARDSDASSNGGGRARHHGIGLGLSLAGKENRDVLANGEHRKSPKSREDHPDQAAEEAEGPDYMLKVPRIHIVSPAPDPPTFPAQPPPPLPSAENSAYSLRRSLILDAPNVPRKPRSPSPERRYVRSVPRDVMEAARRRCLRARVRSK